MIERHGATVIAAPALREEHIDNTPTAREFVDRLARGEFGLVILLTGVGTRLLAKIVAPTHPHFAAEMMKVPLLARGPKPLAALRELGITTALPTDSPFTWHEVLTAVDRLRLPKGTTVAVQEYGTRNYGLYAELEERGFKIFCVPVYRWALPLDTEPLKRAAQLLTKREVDIVVFTSAVQAHHLFQMTDDEEQLSEGMDAVVVASIGPACSETLREYGLRPNLEANPPKLGPLVAMIAQEAPAIVVRNRI